LAAEVEGRGPFFFAVMLATSVKQNFGARIPTGKRFDAAFAKLLWSLVCFSEA